MTWGGDLPLVGGGPYATADCGAVSPTTTTTTKHHHHRQSRSHIPPTQTPTKRGRSTRTGSHRTTTQHSTQTNKNQKRKNYKNKMSIIQQHTAASLTDAWRTINIDLLQEGSSINFDTSTLHPPLPETSEAEVRQINAQVRQLLRGGDAEGALRGCLEMPVYNGSDLAKVYILSSLLFLCLQWKLTLTKKQTKKTGCPPPNRNRGPPVYQSKRHDPDAAAHLLHPGRERVSRRLDEVPVSFCVLPVQRNSGSSSSGCILIPNEKKNADTRGWPTQRPRAGVRRGRPRA